MSSLVSTSSHSLHVYLSNKSHKNIVSFARHNRAWVLSVMWCVKRFWCRGGFSFEFSFAWIWFGNLNAKRKLRNNLKLSILQHSWHVQNQREWFSLNLDFHKFSAEFMHASTTCRHLLYLRLKKLITWGLTCCF